MPDAPGAADDACVALQALAAVGDAVWRWDPVADVFLLSGRAPAHGGNRLDGWLAALHADDRARVRSALVDLAAGTAAQLRVEFRAGHGDGRSAWTLMRGRATGEPGATALVGTLAEIAEGSGTVTALRASHALQQAMLQSPLDAVISIDGSGRILEFNPAAERIFGCASADVVGQPLDEVIFPEGHRAADRLGVARLCATGVSQMLNRRVEVEALRADGTHFAAELTIVPVQAGDAQVFTATLRDISERVSAEAERENLIQRYRVLASKLTMQRLAVDHQVAMVTFDQHGVILSGNDRFAIAVGQPLHDLVGTDVRRIIRSGTLSDAEYDALLSTVKARRAWTGELQIRAADGSPRWLSTSIVPLQADHDQVTEMMMVQTDITPLRSAEAKLRSARDSELSVGALIQQRLLVTAEAPQLRGLDVSSFNRASQGIDGDFLEVFRSGQHCIDLIAGDVMGKGVKAALMSAAVKMQISRSFAELLTTGAAAGRLPGPADVVTAVHRTLTPHLQSLDAFVTLSYLRVDLERRTLQWVGCGHEEPVVLSADGRIETLPNQQPPLGVLAELHLQEDERPIGPDDVLVIHSDGLIDALRADGQRIGHARLIETLDRKARLHLSASALLQTLMRDLLHDTTIVDDLSLVVLRVGDAQAGRTVIELPRRLDGIAAVRAFVERQAAQAGIDEERTGLFTVAAVEAFTNVVRHATGAPPGAPVSLGAQVGPQALELAFTYLADAYEPSSHAPETDFGEYPEGGMGLRIIELACDRVAYEHLDGVNTTRLALKRQAR